MTSGICDVDVVSLAFPLAPFETLASAMSVSEPGMLKHVFCVLPFFDIQPSGHSNTPKYWRKNGHPLLRQGPRLKN